MLLEERGGNIAKDPPPPRSRLQPLVEPVREHLDHPLGERQPLPYGDRLARTLATPLLSPL